MNAFNHDQNSQSSFGTMKNGTKIGPSRAQTALAIRPKATMASEMHLRERDDDQHQPVEQIGEDRPGVRLDEVRPELIEMIEHQLEGSRVEDVGEVVGLVGDQVAERDADAGDRRLVERDQRVAERDEQQQLGEAEQLVPEALLTQHHPDAVPRDQNRGEREEQRVAEAQELRLVGRQQLGDRLLDGRDDRETR